MKNISSEIPLEKMFTFVIQLVRDGCHLLLGISKQGVVPHSSHATLYKPTIPSSQLNIPAAQLHDTCPLLNIPAALLHDTSPPSPLVSSTFQQPSYMIPAHHPL
jgi:hypothetical protein